MPSLRNHSIGKRHYMVGFLFGLTVLAAQLHASGWRLEVLLASSTLLFLILASMSVMKFMGSIGIVLTYASFCSLVFQRTSEMMRNKRTTAARVKTVLTIPIVAIAGYGMVKIYVALFLGYGLGPIEVLLSLYGVWSVMAVVYIVPAVTNALPHEEDEGIVAETETKLKRFHYSLWRGYQTRVRKDFGKVYAKEFERYRQSMERIRGELSGLLLFPMCVVLAVIPPLAGLLIVLWLRMLSHDSAPLTRGERALLVSSSFVVLLVSSVVLVSLSLLPAVSVLDLAYGVGILGSILLLAYVIRKS
ncbi:MAG: hypothetical protein HXY34_01545 [Candidatus Thorarchaeota archaeon]|nr:hypothetical protein [Candidatus Thorarchaeota archaeon]